MTNYIVLTDEQIENLDFNIIDADDLRFEEISILIEWTEPQDERLFTDLNLQEILNLYRVSVDHGDIDEWFEEDPEGALEGYNSAVNPGNELKVNSNA